MIHRFAGVFLLFISYVAVANERPSLVFRDAPLEQVCWALEERFKVEFAVQRSLRQQRITANFSTADLPTILNDIAFVLSIRYERRRQIIIIKK